MRKLLLFLTLLPFLSKAQAPTDDSTQFSPNVAFTPQTWKYKGSNYSNMRFQFNIPGTTKWPQFVTGYQFNHFIGSATAAAIAGLSYTSSQGIYKNGNDFQFAPFGSGFSTFTRDNEINVGNDYAFRIGSNKGYFLKAPDNTSMYWRDPDYAIHSNVRLDNYGATIYSNIDDSDSSSLSLVADYRPAQYLNTRGYGMEYYLPLLDTTLFTEGTLTHKKWVQDRIAEATGGIGSLYARKDSTYNINKNGYDIINKVKFRANLNVSSKDSTLTKRSNLFGLTNTQSARANIGITYASTTNISDFLTVWTLGDSFTSSGYPDTLAAITSRPLIKAGISGNTSGEIITRFRSDPAKWKYTTILAGVGRNDFLIDSGVIKRRVDSMVVSLRSVGNNRFIITPIFNANYPSEWKDSTSYNRIKGINQYWAAKYPNNYVDVRSYLVTTYSTGVYLTHDVTAPLIRSDSLHLTNFGYGQMARYIIAQKLNSLGDSTRVVLTPENLPTIFDSPPTIGRIIPSAATFSSLNVRKTPTSPARWATEIAGSGATERYTYKGYNTAGTEIYSFDPLNGATINNLTTFGTSTYGWDVSPAGSPISRFVLIGRNAASGTVISFDPSTTNTIKNTTSFVTGSSSMQFVPTSTRTRLLSSNAAGTNIGSFDPIGHSYWANGSDFTFGSTTDKGFTLGVTGRIGTDNLRVTTLTTAGILTNSVTGEVGSVAVIPAANGGAGTINGILKANGSGLVSAAVSGTDYVAPSALTGYVPTTRTVTASYGATGGGALSANITLGPDTAIIATKAYLSGNYAKNGSAAYFGDLTISGILAGRGTGAVTNNVVYSSGINTTSIGTFNTIVGRLNFTADATGSTANTAVGSTALRFITTGNNNTAIGLGAQTSLTTGSVNSSLGASSLSLLTTGSDNVGIGGNAGRGVVTGSQNTFVGKDAGRAAGTAGTGNVLLGYASGYNETGDNKLYIANSNTSNPLIWGDFANSLLKFNGGVILPSVTTGVAGTDSLLVKSGIDNKIYKIPASYYSTGGGGGTYTAGNGLTLTSTVFSADTSILAPKNYVNNFASKVFAASTYTPQTRTINNGYGLTGFGNFSADRTPSVDSTALATRPYVANYTYTKAQSNAKYVATTTSPITLPSKNSKNLFNQYYVTLGRGILSGTGGMSNFTAPGRLSNKITIGAGVQFTISYTATATGKYIGYYTSAGALIGSAVQWGNTGTSFTATTPANTAYLYFTASIAGGDSGTSDLNSLQFELGGTATTYDAPEDPFKIINLGTSVTGGFNVTSPAIYFGVTMQSALQPMLGRSVTVFNSGVSGNTSAQMLARLPAVLTANPSLAAGPNVVFIEVSVNDTKSGSYIIPQTTEANTRAMIALVQAAGMIPIIVTPVPIDPTNPLSSEPTMDVNKWHSCLAIARRLGKELNIRVADVTTMMGKSDVTVSPDVLHPSSTYGQWLLAQAYLGALYN